MIPDDAVPQNEARVLVALLRLEHGGGRPTVRSVGRLAGLIGPNGVSTETAHRHLRSLRDRGLVSWEDGHSGTLHSTVEIRRPSPRPQIIRTRRIGRRW